MPPVSSRAFGIWIPSLLSRNFMALCVRALALPVRVGRLADIPRCGGQEISDALLSAMSSLLGSHVPSEAESAQQKAFVTYSYPFSGPTDDPSHARTVTLLESRSVISSSGTTGLRTWEAALLLGSFLASERGQAMIRGKHVVELGAGTGMLSVLCAKHLGVRGMVATDGDEAVVDAIQTNLTLNGLDMDDAAGCPVRTAVLKWGRPVSASSFSQDEGMGVPDVVLGADVVRPASLGVTAAC